MKSAADTINIESERSNTIGILRLVTVEFVTSSTSSSEKIQTFLRRTVHCLAAFFMHNRLPNLVAAEDLGVCRPHFAAGESFGAIDDGNALFNPPWPYGPASGEGPGHLAPPFGN